jgi:hypothetical protein
MLRKYHRKRFQFTTVLKIPQKVLSGLALWPATRPWTYSADASKLPGKRALQTGHIRRASHFAGAGYLAKAATIAQASTRLYEQGQLQITQCVRVGATG